MPVVGVEPTRVISTRDFESPSSAIPTHRLIFTNRGIITDSEDKIKKNFAKKDHRRQKQHGRVREKAEKNKTLHSRKCVTLR